MHPTTYGVTLKKTKVLERKKVDLFLEKNKKLYNKMRSEDCLYRENLKINDPSINYLNIVDSLSENRELNNLIRHEYECLEKVYPKLGSIFVEKFFNDSNIVFSKKYMLNKNELDVFLETITIPAVVDIIKMITLKTTLEYTINIDQHPGKDIFFKKKKNINFNIDYDSSFLGSKKSHAMKNFRFIVIDGMIESVSEIHHLLHEASQNKQPYVIFCFGMSPEVKHVIIENNRKLITEIFPVCLKFDENTINVLGDLSVILNSDVVSAQKGQTISQEVRKSLPKGKEIVFSRSGFVISPSASNGKIFKHRLFLQNRVNESSNSTNQKLLIDRLKRISCKTLDIFLPADLAKDSNFIRELDYGLRFLANSNRLMCLVKTSKNKNAYFIPINCIDILERSTKSLRHTYDNISKLILFEKNRGEV